MKLIKKDSQGNWCLHGLRWEQFQVEQIITQEAWEILYGALCKLKDYENTGHTPEEIMDGKLLTGWIPIEKRLPNDGVNPITGDAYVYPVTVKLGEITDIRFYSFNRGHWYNQGPVEMDNFVIAWMPRPEPFVQQT